MVFEKFIFEIFHWDTFKHCKDLLKVKQIDILDYQWYVDCKMKRMVLQHSVLVKFVFELETYTFSVILFS